MLGTLLNHSDGMNSDSFDSEKSTSPSSTLALPPGRANQQLISRMVTEIALSAAKMPVQRLEAEI